MIRGFRHADLEPVVAVWLDASSAAHDFVGRGFWETRTGLMREVYLPAAETYVFEEDGILKGFASLTGDMLAALFVSPRYQGQGIGTQLLSVAKNMHERLCLTVYRENHRSVEFYRQRGFDVIRRQVDSHTGHDELVMAWER